MGFTKTARQREAIDLLAGPARNVMLYGGSRSGKTFIILYAIIVRALKTKSRHLVLRFRFNHAKASIWHETLPKVFELACPDLKVEWNRTDFFVTLPNGSEIWIGGLDEKERTEKILGTEWSTIFFNECSQIAYDSVVLAMTRLAENSGLVNKALFDCNPPNKKHWTHVRFVDKRDPVTKAALTNPSDYAMMLLNPEDNRDNLPVGYIESVLAVLPGRARERFLLGRWLDVVEGALWVQETIDKHRVTVAPEMSRILVSVDPAVTATKKSDETGIVVVGASDGHAYPLEDVSGRLSPEQWGRRAIEAYYRWKADLVIAEVNQGGDLVASNLRSLDPGVSFKAVNAMRGKIVRAEPVASLYEQGRVHHVGILPELEDQLVNWTGEATFSPDHLDALVHAIHELILSDGGGDAEFVDY